MIKFFRKIRQNLLSENKFSQYLLYAIGEIVLVVIGILIALQINAWNQELSDNKEAQTLIKKLQADIQSDTVQLKRHIAFTKRQLQNIDSIAKILAEPKPDDLLSFIDLQENLYQYRIFNPSQSTYDEAIASGKISLFKKDSVRKKILTYYKDINRYNNDQVMISLSKERILPYLNDHVFNTKEVGSFLFKTTNELPNLDLEKLAKDKNYFGILVTSKGKGAQLESWSEYLKDAEEILADLEKEIER